MSHFGNNLKFVRKAFGWTQVQAADKISKEYKKEITEGRYKSYELGRAEPDYDLLLVITRVFAIDDLILFIEKPLRKIPLNVKILHLTGAYI